MGLSDSLKCTDHLLKARLCAGIWGRQHKQKSHGLTNQYLSVERAKDWKEGLPGFFLACPC